MLQPEHYKYIGLTTKILAALGVAFFVGYRIDSYFTLKIPIFLITLPLFVLISILWDIIRDTSKKK